MCGKVLLSATPRAGQGLGLGFKIQIISNVNHLQITPFPPTGAAGERRPVQQVCQCHTRGTTKGRLQEPPPREEAIGTCRCARKEGGSAQ